MAQEQKTLKFDVFNALKKIILSISIKIRFDYKDNILIGRKIICPDGCS